MYIIERLKNDYPQHVKDLETYDAFLRRYYTDTDIRKIFDDSKDSFYWVNEAFKNGPGTAEYNRCMAYYQGAINFDRDFLRTLVKDSEHMSVEDMRKSLLGKNYEPEREKILKEKYKIKE